MHCRIDSLVWLTVVVLLGGCGRETPIVAPPTPRVTVSQPLVREVTDYEDFTGRTDSVEDVDVRARVSGYLTKVTFKDGDVVKQGALLYQIDPRPFEAALDQAKGRVELLQAERKLLVIQVDRYTKLAAKGASSQQELDEYIAKQAENIGALKAAEAQVVIAALNLEFTRITAPVAGRISRTFITVGNLINADSTLLTTIRSIDPMYAYFNVEEPTVLRIQKMLRDGVIPSKNSRDVPIRMGLADDVQREFPLRGMLDFVNNTIDPQTGTLQVRGVFANPYQFPGPPPVLAPGLFVRVRLSIGPPHRVLLVTERAIGTDQGQKFVYVVGKDNKVGYRRVKLGLIFEGLQAIEAGLQPEDRVVVIGLQRIRPDMVVETDQVDMASLGASARPADQAPAKPAKGGTP